MSNTGDDDKGSSLSNPNPDPNPNPDANSNPPPPNPEQSPSRRRRSGGENPLAASPQRPRQMPILPRQMSPRQTTLINYNRPPPPNFPQWPPPPQGGPTVYGFPDPYGFYAQGSTAVPVGGSGSGSGGVLAANPAARKRAVRDIAAAGRGGDGDGGGDPSLNCSVCKKGFASQKALFGHLRSHPDRGWKGAHPPPTFKAEEEFADLPGVNLQGVVVQEDGVEQVAAGGGAEDADAAVAAEGGEAGQAPEQEVGEPAGERRVFRVPDLNEP